MVIIMCQGSYTHKLACGLVLGCMVIVKSKQELIIACDIKCLSDRVSE